MYDLIIENISRHVQLTVSEADLFKSLLHPRKILKRQYLLQAGDIAQSENFVTKGLLRAYTVNKVGHEHVAMFATEGWWISDLYSFLSGTPASQHIEALEDSEVLSIEKEDLERLYREVPKFERFMRIILQNAFVANQRRVLASISQTAEERYLDFIKRYPSLEQRIPLVQIASYLGITPETLSRVRRNRSRI